MQIADKKFFEYEYSELVFLHLGTPYTGNAPLKANQRAYFGSNNKLLGKRLIALETVANSGSGIQYEIYGAINSAALATFMLTLVNDEGEEVIKNFPLKDLHRFETSGKIRTFNHKINIEKSYVIQSTPGLIINPAEGILFQFYTVST